MKLTFKNIITEDIRKSPKLENAIFKFLKRKDVWRGRTEYEDKSSLQASDDVEKTFGLDEWDAKFFTFKWLVNNGYDSIVSGDDEIEYWVKSTDDKYQFLKDTGWWGKFYQPYNFIDVVEKGKGEDSQKFILVDSYYEFKPLFDNEWISDAVFGDDFVEIFGWNNYPLEEVWDSVDDKGLQSILDVLPSYTSEDNLFHNTPESFLDVVDPDTGSIPMDRITINFIKDGDTSSLLYDLINESDEFDELKGDMVNLYNRAYNDAAHSELFGVAMEELERFFGGTPKWVQVPGSDKNNELNMLEIPIKQEDYDNLYKEWMDTFSDFPEHSYSGYIYSWGEVLRESGDELRFPDLDYFYPDHNIVVDYFNDTLRDNLYGGN